jgi:hypothetical protein
LNDSTILSQALLAKIEEQIERLYNLIDLIPEDSIEWQPVADSMRVCDLLGHLLETLAGFCAVFYRLYPDRLSHFASLREREVNHCCGIEETRKRIQEYRACIKEGFALMTDKDLSSLLPTVFVSEGETILTLLLGNLEHLINHKYQLFFYMKLLSIKVSTPDLYHLRGM